MNFKKIVFSTSTLRGVIQKYLVWLLNTLWILEQKIKKFNKNLHLIRGNLFRLSYFKFCLSLFCLISNYNILNIIIEVSKNDMLSNVNKTVKSN